MSTTTDLRRAHARGCLTKSQHRVAVALGQVLPLGTIISAARASGVRGQIVKARLCNSSFGLVYRLIVITQNGVVRQHVLNSQTGRRLN